MRSSIAVLILAAAFSCNSEKKTSQEQGAAETDTATVATVDEWKEMDEFHLVMAESFHPYMDSSNLAPAKKYAEELVRIARKWETAPLPTRVDDDEMRGRLRQLSTSSQAYLEVVRTNNDDAIGKSLTELHDQFHGVQDAWYHSEGQHEHDHEHDH